MTGSRLLAGAERRAWGIATNHHPPCGPAPAEPAAAISQMADGDRQVAEFAVPLSFLCTSVLFFPRLTEKDAIISV